MSQISAFGGRITIDKPDFYFSPTESYGVLGWVETAILIVSGIIGVLSLLWKTPTTTNLSSTLVKSRLGCGTLEKRPFLACFSLGLSSDPLFFFPLQSSLLVS